MRTSLGEPNHPMISRLPKRIERRRLGREQLFWAYDGFAQLLGSEKERILYVCFLGMTALDPTKGVRNAEVPPR
jgi:hypothetical protein